jgi:type II secretory pathway pseudopilin PulG
MMKRPQLGMTLMEALVVMSLSTVVFGLILNTLIGTQRESDRLTNAEQMHQEALMISQSVERVLRYRVSPADLEGVALGGAAPEAAPGGGNAAQTTSTLPASIAAISSATLTMGNTQQPTSSSQSAAPNAAAPASSTAAPVDNGQPDRLAPAHRAEFTSVPASIQGILGTTSTASAPPAPAGATMQPSPAVAAPDPRAANLTRTSTGQERFAADEVVIYSLGAGPDPGKLVSAVRNSRGLGNVPSHAYIEQSPAGSAFAPAARRRSLGPNPDKFQSQVSFRFASSFDGTNAHWNRETHQVPRLVEYTVRVWPVGQRDTQEPAANGRIAPVFQLTSAVALQ